MSDFPVCEVSWCAALTTGRSRYCPIHAKRPAMSNEKQGDWIKRLSDEDKRAEREAAKKAAEEAAGAKP